MAVVEFCLADPVLFPGIEMGLPGCAQQRGRGWVRIRCVFQDIRAIILTGTPLNPHLERMLFSIKRLMFAPIAPG